MNNRIKSLYEYAMGVNPEEVNLEELNLDETMLDELVELVVSEEEVEAAAESAYKDLMASFEKNEIELVDGDIPEKLAIASLIIKLVELGKIGPEDADEFIKNNLN